MEVCGGEGGEGFGGEIAEGGEGFGGVDHEGGFILLAAMGDGGEERGVGFDEDAVGRGEGGGFADGGGFWVGEVAGEGEVEAGGDGALGLCHGAGEAVHDATEAGGGPVFGDEREEVVPAGVGVAVSFEFGFGGGGGEFAGAAVDEDGFAGGGGDLHLGDEGLLLDCGQGIVEVVVVETDFADGDAAGIGGEGGDFGEVFWGGLVGFLGMDAGAGVDVGVGAGDFERVVHGVGTLADADGEDGFDAGGAGAGDDGFDFAGLLGVEVEVGVRVYEGHCSRLFSSVGDAPDRLGGVVGDEE